MISITDIQHAVASYYGVDLEQLTGPDRDTAACRRRSVAYRLCNELLPASYLSIGREFSRDHTSVIRGLKRPLDQNDEAAFHIIKADLMIEQNHHAEVVRRWPFVSRRKPVFPTFQRRYTA